MSAVISCVNFNTNFKIFFDGYCHTQVGRSKASRDDDEEEDEEEDDDDEDDDEEDSVENSEFDDEEGENPIPYNSLFQWMLFLT